MVMVRRDARVWSLAGAGLCLLLASCGAEPTAETPPPTEAPAELPYVPPDASGDWARATAAEAGLEEAAIESALAFAETRRSSGVVILYDGRIVAERYWEVAEPPPGYSRTMTGQTAAGQAIEDVASVQKSVISFLTGVAEGKGVLDLGAPVTTYLGPGWSAASPDEEAAITVEHLLSMTSGLATDGTYEVPAGTRWQYNTNVYARMLRVLGTVSGLSVHDYTRRWLTEPIGMADSGWTPRPWVRGGADANSVGFSTSARDLARFGLLMIRGGRWGDIDLLGNVGYIGRATAPSQPLNEAYGWLWWLNGQATGMLAGGTAFDGSLVPSAPADLYAGYGARGRKVYVVPSHKLVVTRLGDAPGPDFDDEFWRLLTGGSDD